ncbi:MAG: MarR family winged helix-turn-helix transcriptional regulator [Thalassotalea sp.]
MSSTDNDKHDNPIFNFFKEISIIESLARNQMEKVLPDDMLASHFSVLNRLANVNKKESPAELASAFQVARPSMTNTIQKLTKKAYVSVETDPNDGRGKLVVITEHGRFMHAQALQALAQSFGAIAKNLGVEVFSESLPALQKIRTYMDENRD